MTMNGGTLLRVEAAVSRAAAASVKADGLDKEHDLGSGYFEGGT
jgi:hypothetical protein